MYLSSAKARGKMYAVVMLLHHPVILRKSSILTGFPVSTDNLSRQIWVSSNHNFADAKPFWGDIGLLLGLSPPCLCWDVRTLCTKSCLPSPAVTFQMMEGESLPRTHESRRERGTGPMSYCRKGGDQWREEGKNSQPPLPSHSTKGES